MQTKQIRDAEAFLKHVECDAEIRKQLQQIKSKGNERLAEIVRIAAEAGFNFTTQEYEEAARAQVGIKGDTRRQNKDEQITAVGSMN